MRKVVWHNSKVLGEPVKFVDEHNIFNVLTDEEFNNINLEEFLLAINPRIQERKMENLLLGRREATTQIIHELVKEYGGTR